VIHYRLVFVFVFVFALVALGAEISAQDGWQSAVRGRDFVFPRDHSAHPESKTEWWYFVGHLDSEDGSERLGFQFTLFRQGLRPPGSPSGSSRFLVSDFHFGHLAISDLKKARHWGHQRVLRGSFGEAGTGQPGEEQLVWVGDWSVDRVGEKGFRIRGSEGELALDLELTPTKPIVLQGDRGYSPKAAGKGNASNYYSQTRLSAKGSVAWPGRSAEVRGDAWLDREWSTSMLGADQAGWDWFALQFEDGTELMIYQMRKRDGTADPFSSGTFVDQEGRSTRLMAGDFTLRPLRDWTSAKSGGQYPVKWEVKVPGRQLSLEVEAAFDEQEMALGIVNYWEGSVGVKGTHSGRGYLEMTGYAGDLVGLRGLPESKNQP